ncbi:MAG: DUF3313 family protein [Allosphingosinicella sp.]
MLPSAAFDGDADLPRSPARARRRPQDNHRADSGQALRGAERRRDIVRRLERGRFMMKALKLTIIAAFLAAVPLAAQDSNDWEGLIKVRSKSADNVWLAPGVDFRPYTKVMLDPTEVAFRRNWQRDYNRSALGGNRISDAEAAEISEAARTGFEEVFAEEYRRAGYQIVTQPGPDVVRVRTGIANLYIAAPEQMSAGRTRTYSSEAGEATLIFEVRDSVSRAVLGRAIDSRLVGDLGAGYRRTSVSNRADFEQLFRQWARLSVRGLERLKAESPVSPEASRR